MKKYLLQNRSTYLILTGVCIGILLIEILAITIFDKMNMDKYINDAIAEGVLFFVCFPGIILGIAGAGICSFKKK